MLGDQTEKNYLVQEFSSQNGTEYVILADDFASYECATKELGLLPDSLVFHFEFDSKKSNNNTISVSQKKLGKKKVSLLSLHISPQIRNRFNFKAMSTDINEINFPIFSTLKSDTLNTFRTWFYVPDIDNNYSIFNRLRDNHYNKIFPKNFTHFPASTAIGQKPDVDHKNNVACAFLSVDTTQLVKQETICVHQFMNDPISYGIPFTRAQFLSFEDREHLYISGTASINKLGEVVHLDNIEKQFFRTIENLEALLKTKQMTMEDIAYFCIYLRNADDAADVEKLFIDKFPKIPYILLEGAVCRPQWLIEIDGLAIRVKN